MIYYLEDDKNIRELVIYTLGMGGLSAEGFAKVADFEAAMKEKLPDLILLDIMLPDGDGIEILKNLKRKPQYSSIPVIMISAKGSEFDKVLGLDLGADDYITKPFAMIEFVSRVKALLRRTNQSQTETGELRLRNVVLNSERHTVTVNDEEVNLTVKEFELLKMLLENRGIVLTRDTLLNKIWGYDFDGETRTVDVHVRSLRQKLGDGADVVETVRGVGYKAAYSK
ncbi:MAG: response regulator transcription factor [Eubacteriales bacterium]|nr:response regulator transcription factor [Eubacteriales bacterium]MDD4474739.1 response regulator transcription factor [Eubacteriales bacterium]